MLFQLFSLILYNATRKGGLVVMKLKLRTGILTMLGIMLIFSIPLVANTEEESVEFEDRDLELAIREEIGKAMGDIYPSDLKQVKNLKVVAEEVEDLSVLKHCNNLKWIDFRYNKISDLSALSGLTNLEVLWLKGNRISDISPLSDLSHLRRLWLQGNNISNIQPLIDNFKVKDNGKKVGLGKGDTVKLQDNKLNRSEGSKDLQDIQTLLDRGVEVEFHPQKEGESS